MQRTITFEKASIKGVEYNIKNNNVAGRLNVVASFSPEVARAIDAGYLLFDRQKMPKAGFKGVDLDFELQTLRARFGVPGMKQELEVEAQKADSFHVKKTAKKQLTVEFKVHHTGNPFPTLEYLLKVGSAQGSLVVEGRQQEMALGKDEKKATKGKKPRQVTVEEVTNPAAKSKESTTATEPAPEGAEALAFPAPRNSGVSAVIHLLQRDKHAWTYGLSVTTPVGGFSQPMGKDLVFHSRYSAIEDAANTLNERLEAMPTKTAASEKAHRKLREWAAGLVEQAKPVGAEVEA